LLFEGLVVIYQKNSIPQVGHNSSYKKKTKTPRELRNIIEIEDSMCRIRFNSIEIWFDE